MIHLGFPRLVYIEEVAEHEVMVSPYPVPITYHQILYPTQTITTTNYDVVVDFEFFIYLGQHHVD